MDTKRLLLFIIAVIFCTTGAKAVTEWYGSKLPVVEQYIHFDRYVNGILHFSDHFQKDVTLVRGYTIYVVKTRENNEYKFSKEKGGPYAYQGFPNDWDATAKKEVEKTECKGKIFAIDVADLVDACYEMGYTKITFIVEPAYYSIVGGKQNKVSYYQGSINEWVANYFEVELPNNMSTIIADTEVRYGNQLEVEAKIHATYNLYYKLQRSKDEKTWETLRSGIMDYEASRTGRTVSYKSVVTGTGNEKIYYRLIQNKYYFTDNGVVWPGISDTLYYEVNVLYPLYIGDEVTWVKKGTKINLPDIGSCAEWKVSCALPLEKDNDDNYLMPACPTYFYSSAQVYTVTFLDADHKVLKTQMVSCGDEVVPPANPTWLGLKFKGWSKDFSEVHEDMKVMALYDMDENLTFNTAMTSHENDNYPVSGFSGAKDKAMIGDQLTFIANISMMIESNINLYYETASYDAGTGQLIWTAPTNNLVGTYTVYDSQHSNNKQFSQSVYVCYNPDTKYENPFQHRFAFRFYLVYHGTKVYSEPYEFDVYYHISFNSNLTNPSNPLTPEELYAANELGVSLPSNYVNIPARYGEKVVVSRKNGIGGACLVFKRVMQPTRDLETGVYEDGNAYIVCPGETETIEVSARRRVVVFDGVYGNGYPKQFDFSAEGKGKFNGYYAQIVDCGSSVTVPDDPEMDGSVFTGWQAWSDEYADNAYLEVPAGDDPIGFTAQWEEVPPVPVYTVCFYGKDGSPLLSTQTVGEGSDAVPPTAPTIAGWTFKGWNKSYVNIMGNTDITALYLDDSNKMFFVSYKDRKGAIDSDDIYVVSGEIVDNGKAATGTAISRLGYQFICWSSSPQYDDYTPADLSNITADTEVYAKWQATGGDVNKDGTIDKKDVELTSKYIMGKNPANFFKDAADMDGKGGVNAADLVLLIDKMKMNQ